MEVIVVICAWKLGPEDANGLVAWAAAVGRVIRAQVATIAAAEHEESAVEGIFLFIYWRIQLQHEGKWLSTCATAELLFARLLWVKPCWATS